jgi:sterol desaturase/sphingolipid hydroxylase (fatty acid hydroxylase superfamily)
MIVLQVAWLAFLGLAELAAAEWPRVIGGQRRRARNLAFTVVNHMTIPPLSLLLVQWLSGLSGAHADTLVAALPAYAGIPLAIVIFDFAGYWFHRISHRSLFLWRFHQIHHLDEDFDFTTGARVHTFEALMHQLALVWVAVSFGIPVGYLTISATVSFVMALLHHSNVVIPWNVEKWLRLVIFTPATHVAHHHDQIEDTDTNFGFIFPWFDRVFGTYNTRARTAQWRIGLDYSADLGFSRLALQPFLPTQLKDSLKEGSK